MSFQQDCGAMGHVYGGVAYGSVCVGFEWVRLAEVHDWSVALGLWAENMVLGAVAVGYGPCVASGCWCGAVKGALGGAVGL